MNEETSIKVSFKNNVSGQKKLDEYAKRLKKVYSLLDAIESGKDTSLSVIQIKTKDIQKEEEKEKKTTNSLGQTISKAFGIGAMVTFIKSLRVLSKKMADVVKLSASYVENINLLEVAYANINRQTGEFNESIESSSARIENYIDKMSEAYGLDESRLTRSFGVFRQLANAMELPTETAEHLSEMMVKMTNDVASLYNLDLNRASNALQSALVGQVRPIRGATGADITEKTLQKTVDELGLDRTISQLSFVEKRLIMVVSLTKQLKNSQGDWARTIESTSNQMRILKEQWERLTRAVGNVFYPVMEKILPYLNATLMVLTEIANLVAGLLGFKMPEFDYSSLSGASDALLDLEDELNSTGDAVDNLKNKMSGLRSFDKLNNLTTPKSTSSSISAGSIDPKILDAFNTAFENYNDMMDEINMKAHKIRDVILDWLGFSDGTYKNLKLIAGILGTLVGLKILKGVGKLLGIDLKTITKIFNLIKDGKLISTITKKLGTLLTSLKGFLGVLGKILTVVGGITLAIQGAIGIIKQYDNAMDGIGTSTSKTALSVAELSTGGALLGTAILPGLGSAIGAVAGGLVALAVYGVKAKQSIKELAKRQVFGSLNITVSQWNDIIEKSVKTTNNFSSSMKNLQDTLESYNTAFEDSINELNLFGYKYGVIGQQISEEDAPKILSAIENIGVQSTAILQASTDNSIAIWGGLFDEMDTLAKEDEESILTSIAEYGAKQEETIAIAQKNITETYNRAIKERGYLTDSEKTYIEEQLRKIQEITEKEMSKNQANIEYYKTLFADKNTKLDEESYANFKTALDNYNKERLEAIEENYKIALQDATYYYNQGALDYDEYQNSLTTAYDKRVKDTEELSTELEKIEQGVYESLANTYADMEDRTDETATNVKQTIESIFANIDVKPDEITSKFAMVGRQCAWSIQDAFNSTKLKLNLNTSQITGTNTSYQLPFTASVSYRYKDGGFLPPVGNLFVMNEQGPELLSTIGGKSFVANQNQMMDLLDKKIGNAQAQQQQQVFNIYLDENNKLGTYTLEQLQGMARTNGRPITIGG